MAEFSEVIKALVRMCESNERCDSCGCHQQLFKNSHCNIFQITNVAKNKCFLECERIAMKWAAEHPEPCKKTYAEVFFELFPNAQRSPARNPTVCRKNMFGGVCNYSAHGGFPACVTCWNEIAPDEYQEGDNVNDSNNT